MAKNWHFVHREKGKALVTVEMPDVTAAILEEVLTKTAPGLLEMMEEGISTIHADAQRRWPVKRRLKKNPREYTGRSKENLKWGVAFDGEVVGGRIYNVAVQKDGHSSYWQFIKTNQNGINGQPIQVLVRAPMGRLKKWIKASFPDLFKRTVRPRRFTFKGAKRV